METEDSDEDRREDSAEDKNFLDKTKKGNQREMATSRFGRGGSHAIQQRGRTVGCLVVRWVATGIGYQPTASIGPPTGSVA